MSGMVDWYRRFVVDSTPVATGLVALADAWSCTNPSAGRGLTLEFIHAVRLRDVLRQGSGDPVALARQFNAVTDAEVTLWYRAQLAMDRFRFARCVRCATVANFQHLPMS
jgi:hypothetical protein